MSTQLKLRRGTTAQHSTFTGAEGEITVDTTKDTVVVHDGTTAGGIPLAKESALSGYVSTSGGAISANTSTDALRITQTGAGNALVVEDSANPDSTPVLVNRDGQFLIGSSTVNSKVYDPQTPNGRSPYSQIQGVNSTGAGHALISWNSATTSYYSPSLYLAKSASDTFNTQAIVTNGTTLGSLMFSGDDGANFVGAALIQAQVDGTPGTNDMPGRLVFSTTADGASSPTERMRIRSDGNVAIGNSGNPNVTLTLAKDITGSTTAAGIYQAAVIQSGVTSAANINWTNIFTAASAFTVNTINHYYAVQNTIGAGSAVTNQRGFNVDSSLTGATNNYGFYSGIASGTGRYNFYAAGTADNYFAGNVGINETSFTSKFHVTTPSQGGIATFKNTNASWAADVNVSYSPSGTETSAIAFSARSDGSAWITTNYGATVFRTGTGGSASERMRIDSSGRVGIGASPATSTRMLISGVQTGNTSQFGCYNDAEIQSDVTSVGGYFTTSARTAAASFTLGSLHHYSATKGTFGAGSTVTNQYGYIADASLTGATNNYGFYSNIAAGTGRWNFYAAGSADNYFAGNTGFGGIVPTTFITLNAAGTTNGIAGVSGSTYLWGLTRNGSNGVAIDAYGDITFVTNSASGSKTGTERMRIDSAGGVGIGAPSYAGNALSIGKALTGATTAQQVNAGFTINSDVTSAANVFSTYPTTQAAAFTLNTLRHYTASQNAFGAGSTVTSQRGFEADASLTGATNNYGFYSNIASGTGRYNFYAAGSADNYFAGKVGIGGSVVSPLNVVGTWVTGNGIFRIDATAATTFSGLTLQNGGVTRTYFYDDNVNNLTFLGAVGARSLVFATNTDGTSGERMRITSTGNIYGTSGTTGMTDGFFYIPSAAGAPSGTPTAVAGHVPMYYDTTNNKFYIYNGAWKSVTLA